MQNKKILPLLLAAFCQPAAYAEPATSHDLDSLRREMSAMQEQLDKLTVNQPAGDPQSPYGLQLSGFFDVTVNLSDINDQPFALGDLELDALYDQGKNYTVSSAIVVNDDGAGVAVALLDYHVQTASGDNSEESGFHIQLGRFDLPFASDYSFYAAPDRINISAPLTTDRVQDGGLNGDGLGIYGGWSDFDYTFYSTNSLYGDTGYSAGARLGYARDNLAIGLSALTDRDENDDTRSRLTGLDIRYTLGMAEISAEALQLDSEGDMEVGATSYGPADEKAAHISLALDFSPVTVFVRYEKWTPDYTAVPDESNSTPLAVEELERATLAARYLLDDNLQFKLEYSRYTSGETEEADFDRNQANVQMVASF
ncbi:MAG: hypothetical protein QG652_1506 [Pseudomonadota bacterium]|nr:hypothetical protein [Pseudomonadota bacterium]